MENLVTCYISGNKLAILFVYWVKDELWDFRNKEWGLLLVVLRILHQIIRLSLSCWHLGIIEHSRFFGGMGSLAILLGCPRATALSALLHALNLHWSSILHMVIYTFQCYSVKSSHPCPLPHSSKVYSLHLCFFCCHRLQFHPCH